jgi:membrane peptidoglycan carboxypeptidase
MPQPTNWRELYEAALLEYNPTKLDQRVEAAHKAIHRRLTQNDYISPEERQKIDDALSALFTLTRERNDRAR